MSKPQKPTTIHFGRIIQDPDRYNGAPVLHASGIKVNDVIHLICQGKKSSEIFDHFPSGAIGWDDLQACRAWQARFMPESLSDIFNRVTDENVIMLDENMPYFLLHEVTRTFGRSSHVFADGLIGKNNRDGRDIWSFLVRNEFKAIFTRDDDFREISSNHRQQVLEAYGQINGCPETVPVVIEVRSQLSRAEMRDLLTKFSDDIHQFIKENDATYATLDEKGLVKQQPDPDDIKPNPLIADIRRLRNCQPDGPF